MVQFKSVDTAYRKKSRTPTSSKADNYWKLGLYRYKDRTVKNLIQYLKNRGYHCRENISRPDAIDAIGRYQRGLMSYDGLTLNELQALCKARGLPGNATRTSNLVRTLRKADDLATFPKFFDLPAEIRNIIYELFFRSLPNFDDKHFQPPLTMASRQLRAESLSLFYECATFEMFARSLGRNPSELQDLGLRSCTRSLMYMPAANFDRIKTFNLFWSKHPEKRSRGDGDKVVKIVVHMEHGDVTEDPYSCYCEPLGPKIEEHLYYRFSPIEDALWEQEKSAEALEMHIDGRLYNDMEGEWGLVGNYTEPGALVLRTFAD